MRCGYSEDVDARDLAMWRGRVASSIRGKRGQSLLKVLLKSLDDMPEKRLIRNDLVDEVGDVCLLGAGGRAMRIVDINQIDPEDHDVLAQRFDVPACLIQEIEFINDEMAQNETPEKRWIRMRDWLTKQIRTVAA